MGASGTFQRSGSSGRKGGRDSAGTVLLWSVHSHRSGARAHKHVHGQQKKKEKEKGQRLSTGNAIKSSVKCETLSRLRRPFVGEEPFHDYFEPDDWEPPQTNWIFTPLLSLRRSSGNLFFFFFFFLGSFSFSSFLLLPSPFHQVYI